MSAEESTIQPVVDSAPAPVETPVAAETPETPKAPESRRDIIIKAMQTPRAERPRQADGKFAATTPQFPTPQPAKTGIQRPPMPRWITPDLVSHWDKTPIELAEIVARREADHEQGVLPLQEKAKRADEILNEFQPYEMLMRMENTTPAKAIGPLLQTAAILRTGSPAQKAHAVATTMRQFNIPLEHIQSIFSGSVPPQSALDPQISQLHQQVQQLTQFQQQQEIARANRAINTFSADPAHKHFNAVSEHMTQLLMNPATIPGFDESMTEPEKLQLAYDTAIYANPQVRQLVLSEQQAAQAVTQQTTQQVARAKQAAVQIKGSPASGPPPKADPKDRKAILQNAFARFR